jgi:hypothetical protein
MAPTASLPDTPAGRLLGEKRSLMLECGQRYGITRMRIFGSVARGEDEEGSDIDIAIDCPPRIGLFSLMSLHDELSMILGRSVDLAITEGLKPRVRENFEQDAITL